MNRPFLPALGAGCLALASLACGGAPTADQRTISDPVPNVSLTERDTALDDVPPAEVGKTGRISDPVDQKPLSEVDPAPLDEAPAARSGRMADPIDDEAPPAEPPVPPPAVAPCASDDDTCRIDRLGDVQIGWLKEGMPRAAIIAQLGEPARREGPMEEGATGEWITFAAWPAAGISIDFSATTEGGAQTARGITVVAPFAGKTDRGIGIGSTEGAVRAAYGDALDPRGGLVAGSVYGGVFFGLDDQGRVSRIFVGPGAE